MPRVVHFEIPASDPEKLITFFRNVFGWQFQKWDGPMEYWMVLTGSGEPGIDGGLMRRRDPAQPIVNTVEVAAIDPVLETISAHGGVIVVPKMAIPGVGWLAYFKDPDGNIHGVMQSDTAAA